MKSTFFLVINSKGAVRAVKNQPGLDWNEISMQLSVELPDSLFKRPILQGNIVVGEENVQPLVITPEIQNNIQNAIKEHSGVEVKLNLIESEK